MKKTHPVVATLLIVAAFALFGCAGGSGSNSDDDEDLTSESGTPVAEEPITQSATQPASLDVDILFVLDSSSSIETEREELAAAVQQLIGEFQEITGTYTVAFTLGWISEDPAQDGSYAGSGRLYSLAQYPPVLSFADMNEADIVNAVADTLRSGPPTDPLSDGGEAGLQSLNNLLTKHQDEAHALGFLRPGAAFVAIFLSDEDDICLSVGNPSEDPARENCDASVTPNSVLAAAQSAVGVNTPVQFSGIVYTGPEDPGPGNEIAHAYLEAISLSGGVAVDLASSDISQGARNLGNAINALAANLQRRFVLTQGPVNSLSIEVLVDGEPVGFEFIEAENAVVLDYAGHPGSVIEITYRVLDE